MDEGIITLSGGLVNLDKLEGFIEVKGRCPILVTALHGFGSDRYRLVVKTLRKYLKDVRHVKTLGICDELTGLTRYSSSVDVYTWEIAYKVAVSEELWSILPTLSKVDEVESMNIPDYNLNKSYASSTLFWKRVRELIEKEHIRIVIDVHGMKDLRVWPDICISTRRFTSSSREFVETLALYFMRQGLKVSIDFPFIGGAFIAFLVSRQMLRLLL